MCVCLTVLPARFSPFRKAPSSSTLRLLVSLNYPSRVDRKCRDMIGSGALKAKPRPDSHEGGLHLHNVLETNACSRGGL